MSHTTKRITNGEFRNQFCFFYKAISQGRDASAIASTKTGVGGAGFDFTKIANNGDELLPNAALGKGLKDWACTRDNVTGLI